MIGDAQAAAIAAMRDCVGRYGEVGMQVAAYHRGERVVHAWLGTADPETGRAVDADTVFLMFSCSKAITATVIHRLAQRGRVDYDAHVASYWPEFAASGKGGITVRHVLSHRAGLPEVAGASWVDQWNLADAARAVAGAEPSWPAGSTMQYHPVTFGSILGTIACRITGLPFVEVVRREVGDVAGTADLHFGIGPGDPILAARRARLMVSRPFPSDPIAGEPSSDSWATARTMVDLGEDPRWVHGTMPAANLTCTADALARHYAAMRPGGIGGEALLDTATIALVSEPCHGADGVTLQSGMGLGYMLGAVPFISPTGWRFAPWHGAFGHDGSGGRAGMYCPKHDLAIALAKNAHSPSGFGLASWSVVVDAIAVSLGIPLDVTWWIGRTALHSGLPARAVRVRWSPGTAPFICRKRPTLRREREASPPPPPNGKRVAPMRQAEAPSRQRQSRVHHARPTWPRRGPSRRRQVMTSPCRAIHALRPRTPRARR